MYDGVQSKFCKQGQKGDIIDRLESAPKFDAELEAGLRDAITEFKAQYVKDNPKALAA